MEIIRKLTKDLIPYDKNPRINDKAVNAVMASIKEFGFKVPIVIDSANVVITGHTRLKAAKKLKLKYVPCIIATDLTDQQIKAFRLVDNKTSELADWDYNLLNLELESLDFGLEEYGFEIENEVKLNKIELKPYNKVHYLISIDINQHDQIIKAINYLKKVEGVEIESTLN